MCNDIPGVSHIFLSDTIWDVAPESTINASAPLSNGGSLMYNKSGNLSSLPDIEVYYNPDSIANLLSMAYITENYRVTMDSAVENSIVVHVGNGNDLKFLMCARGIYYFDTKVKSSVTGYFCLSSVVSNKLYYNRLVFKGADDARLLQGRIGWPSDADYKQYIMKKCRKDCSTTVDHITNGKPIYGPLVPVLQGKMVRRQPHYRSEVKRIPIPSL